jgi:DNA-binding CsgD family transcriptional regulator
MLLVEERRIVHRRLPLRDIPATSAALIRCRERVRLVLLDDSLGIVFAEPEGIRLLAANAGALPRPAFDSAPRLPDEIEREVRNALQSGAGEVSSFITVGAVSIRMRRVHNAQGSATALLVSRQAQRDPLRSAARRYSLSHREVMVLRLILDGMSGAEIAASLHICEGTVKDYFEHLLRKTAAKNRSQMIANVLEYVPHEASLNGYTKVGLAPKGRPMRGECPFVEVQARGDLP